MFIFILHVVVFALLKLFFFSRNNRLVAHLRARLSFSAEDGATLVPLHASLVNLSGHYLALVIYVQGALPSKGLFVLLVS